MLRHDSILFSQIHLQNEDFSNFIKHKNNFGELKKIAFSRTIPRDSDEAGMEYSLENCMFLSNLNNSGTSK
jgi:hypothetical protein